MANEALISRLFETISEITRLGGEEERTAIVPNILVADDSPSDLPSGYIKIVNPRDGTYVPCLVVAGLVVSTGDLVNVLFTKGTEPVALTQGSGSPGSNSLWKRVVTELSPFNDADSVAVYDDASTQRIEINPGTSSTEAFWEVRDQTGALKLRLSTDNSYRFLVSRGGLDVSQNIFRVDVTGTPQLEWDETNDVFTWNKGHTLSAGDLTIPDDLVHAGDTDTLLSFTDDQINIQAGGITMIRLDETVQDVLYLGDVAGTGDVDVNLNNGQVTLTGSTGNVVITNGLSMGTVIGNLLMASVGSVIGGTGSSNPSIGASASANRVGNIYMASSTFINALNSYYLSVGPIGTDINMIQLTDSGQDTLDLGDVAGTGDVDIDFSNGQMFLEGSSGKLGIGTITIPHGGIGAAKLALEGTDSSVNGPHIQATTPTDDYPIATYLNWSHDNVQWMFDAYFDGTNWRSSDAGSNFRFLKNGDKLWISSDVGIAQGSVITWDHLMIFDPTNLRIGVGISSPAVPFDIDANSNAAGLRLRGAAGTVEIADFYVGATGNLIIDLTAGADTFQYLDIRTESSDLGVVIRESDGTGTAIYANLHVIDATLDYLNIVISDVASTLGFCVTDSENIGLRTASEFGSGTGVFGIQNATANPSVNPTGGGVLYSTGGAGTWRGSGGTTTTFGPAEPHCPTCGRDAVLNMYNEDQGWHITLCWTCFLREIMGANLTKPAWVVKAEGV